MELELDETERRWAIAGRIEKFLFAGTAGLGVNVFGLWVLHGHWGVPLKTASAAAIALSMAATFLLNEFWTWGDRDPRNSFWGRVGLYGVINGVGMLINWSLLLRLSSGAGCDYLAANVVGASAAAVWNFLLHHFVTWKA